MKFSSSLADIVGLQN